MSNGKGEEVEWGEREYSRTDRGRGGDLADGGLMVGRGCRGWGGGWGVANPARIWLQLLAIPFSCHSQVLGSAISSGKEWEY